MAAFVYHCLNPEAGDKPTSFSSRSAEAVQYFIGEIQLHLHKSAQENGQDPGLATLPSFTTHTWNETVMKPQTLATVVREVGPPVVLTRKNFKKALNDSTFGKWLEAGNPDIPSTLSTSPATGDGRDDDIDEHIRQARIILFSNGYRVASPLQDIPAPAPALTPAAPINDDQNRAREFDKLAIWIPMPKGAGWDTQQPLPVTGNKAERKWKSCEGNKKVFYLFKRDPLAIRPRRKSNSLVQEGHQTPEMATFLEPNKEYKKEEFAWACTSVHSSGPAAGMICYNSGSSCTCWNRDTSRKKSKRKNTV
ncbi:hypothetical protein E8E13_009760 [Curvularia kusanoi]|uniref:Uncharacterized protein n=1 Tax=Curvularia kusanoi TaxID=90978 RepID=A0A9P4W992_CURKU|nr:hypothetical protein E8E13_009760 [Curvularia kusanoi]